MVTERLSWRSVGNGFDERLLIRLSSSKAIEADLVVRKINLDPYETMRPERINQVRPQEDLDGTAVIGAAQEDDRSLERQLEIKFPAVRERAAWRCSVEARCRSVPCGLHKAIRLLRKGGEIFMFEADPDLGLPAAIVVFNGGLKSGFLGRREDRRHTELQTETDHAAEGITIHSVAQEDGAVVELGVFRKTVLAPVCNQCFDRELGSPNRSDPTATEPSVQADGIQNHDLDAAANDEAFHEIKAVELRLLDSDTRQMPTFGWWRTANSYSSIKSTAAQEDSTDRAKGWNSRQAVLCEGAMNGGGAVLTEITRQLELPSETQDQVFRTSRRCSGSTSSAPGRIGPVDAVESLPVRASNPILNRRERNMKSPCDSSLGKPASHRGNQPLSPGLKTVFCASSTLPMENVFRSILTDFD